MANTLTPEQTRLLRRADAALKLIRDGADPLTMLAAVVWPRCVLVAVVVIVAAATMAGSWGTRPAGPQLSVTRSSRPA